MDLTRLADAADRTGFTTDFIEALTRGLDESAFDAVIGNLEGVPGDLTRTDNPLMRRDFMAAYGDRGAPAAPR